MTTPALSLTYWAPTQDTCTADCRAVWETSPEAPAFGILRLEPERLRVMPGTVMLKREGELLTWRRSG
jgi:hypothetical protein